MARSLLVGTSEEVIYAELLQEGGLLPGPETGHTGVALDDPLTPSFLSPLLPLLPTGLHRDPSDEQDASPHEFQEQTRKPGQAWQAVQTAGPPPVPPGSSTLSLLLQGNRLSCRDQEGRRGSEEAVPGP